MLIGHAAPWAARIGGSYTDETTTAATLNEQPILDAATKVIEMQQEGSLVTASDVSAA